MKTFETKLTHDPSLKEKTLIAEDLAVSGASSEIAARTATIFAMGAIDHFFLTSGHQIDIFHGSFGHVRISTDLDVTEFEVKLALEMIDTFVEVR